jgi:hypothetical protein
MWGLALVLAGAVVAEAQPPARPGEHHPPGQMAPGGPGSAPTMEMCRQMMAGHHGPGQHGPGRRHMGDPMGPMMGMGMGGMMAMMGPGADPKMAAQMMEMRGEMMKAMGEILVKYGQRMQSAPPR